MNRLFKPLFALGLVIYLAIQILSLSLRQKETLRPPEKVIVYIAAPIQNFLGRTLDWVGEIWFSYIALIDTVKVNEKLKVERDLLRRQLIELKEEQSQNIRLRELLSLTSHSKLHMVVAEQIAAGASPYERTIRINRGLENNVRQGMAVLNAKGVVGQVLESFDNYADILLLIDRASAIDVVVQRTRARGILRGDRMAHLRFEYLPKSEEVAIGDELVTTGLDGVYPEGIPVGTVSEVNPKSEGLFLEARANPYTDFNRISEVAIVTGTSK